MNARSFSSLSRVLAGVFSDDDFSSVLDEAYAFALSVGNDAAALRIAGVQARLLMPLPVVAGGRPVEVADASA